MNDQEFNEILKRPGYGIASSFRKRSIESSIRSNFSQGSVDSKVHNAGKVSDTESAVRPEPVFAQKTTLNYSGQCVVRVKVYRKRLVDVDGNCIKYHLDFLRYIGALKDDSNAAVRLVFEGQEKVESEKDERVEVTVEYPEFNFDKPFISC